jgi:hypothetical protein
MATHDPNIAADQPPTPGGDPDQPSSDEPKPPARKPTEDSEHKNKSGYGHIGNNDEPRPEGAPPPHQIF